VAEQLDYEALAADSDFPRSPPRAAISFGSPAPLAIEGAPGEMVAGTAVQLGAASPEPVSWSATAGTVSASGRFTAPAVPGDVRVRASTAGGSADAVTRAQRVGRFVAVSVRAGRSGALRFVLRRAGRTLDDCRVRRTVAGRASTCRLRPPRRAKGRLRVAVQLKAGGRTLSRAVAVRSGAHVH